MLSGLGTYLFVREVTGSARAGFVAGLIYAFAPYRVPQFAHLQVLSSQWMPFALYGLRRYLRNTAHDAAHRRWCCPRRTEPLQRLFHAVLLTDRRSVRHLRNRDATAMARRIVCGLSWPERQRPSSLLTLPFFLPYLELRRLGFPPRPLNEIVDLLRRRLQLLDRSARIARLGSNDACVSQSRRAIFFQRSPLSRLPLIGLIAAVRSSWQKTQGIAMRDARPEADRDHPSRCRVRCTRCCSCLFLAASDSKASDLYQSACDVLAAHRWCSLSPLQCSLAFHRVHERSHEIGLGNGLALCDRHRRGSRSSCRWVRRFARTGG